MLLGRFLYLVLFLLQDLAITNASLTSVLFIFAIATADEWEKVAHRGVSIAAHIMEATQLVISWRKQELSYWKNLLRLHFIRYAI